jgi:undecaprenyl diphosphate synthase
LPSSIDAKFAPDSGTGRNLPRHVAIIMDGNGRWARERGLSRVAGHREGVKSVREIVRAASARGLTCLTLFAFSSENWSRPREEVSSLMKLFLEALRREVDELHQNSVRLSFIGARERLQPDLVRKIDDAERKTSGNSGLHLVVAVAYGGRWDITEACRRLAEEVEQGRLRAADVSEELVARRLQLSGLPDPDLLVRTGGELRISNFLLWNLAYSELFFSEKLWPDFDEAEFDKALAQFAARQRRFGYTGEQVATR